MPAPDDGFVMAYVSDTDVFDGIAVRLVLRTLLDVDDIVKAVNGTLTLVDPPLYKRVDVKFSVPL